MKLYGFDISNYTNIVKQTLLEEGFPFETVTTPPNQEADYLAISPMGKIPAAETENGVLCETRAILSYIAASHPENTLFPTDAYTKAQHEELYSLVDLYIEHPARRQLAEAFFSAPRNEATYAEVKPAVERGLRALDSRFSPSPYVFGEFSVADIYLFHCLNLASRLMQVSYDWDILAEVDGMSDWFERVKSREVTQRVLADQAEAMQAMMAKRD
ncbi:MAG: glutathione S-transferase family protein [Pseudomonadales bacterium]